MLKHVSNIKCRY